MTDKKKNEEANTEEEKDNRDDIDKLLDELDDEATDDKDDKANDDKDKEEKDDSKDEENKPLTVRELKSILNEMNKSKSSDVSFDEFKNEFKKEIQEMIKPVMELSKNTDLKRAVEKFEDSVRDNLPKFSVDMDLLEYHLSSGKSRNEALKLQAVRYRDIADSLGYKKEDNDDAVDKDGGIDFENFDPEFHKNKQKEFMRLPKPEKDKYWEKLSIFKRKK